MKPRITFLDDDTELLALYEDISSLLGVQAETYSEPERFLENIDNSLNFGLLVLDLSMPMMDGIQVMRELVVRNIRPSLILVSGYDKGVLHSAEQLGKAHGLEILATLSKPIDLEKFETLINQYLLKASSVLAQEKTTFVADVPVSREELAKAIQQRELFLNYQPKVNLSDGKIVGVEALVRWSHPERGMIYPNSFIGLAESQGLIGDLTYQVIQMAVEQSHQWRQQGFDVPISVNVSADNITSLSLPEQLTDLLSRNMLDSSGLILEVTESVLMGELVTSLDVLTRLRMKGVGLSIDDFGTGFSSLSQLHKIAFTELKIDSSFVMSMLKDTESKAIVKTCIMLGHELNMKVVAEGVETEEHWELLQNLGCDIAQGYYIDRPILAEEVFQIYQQKVVR